MKTKLILIIALTFTLIVEAQAGTRCGVGSKIFGGQKGLLSQLLVIGTNAQFSGYASISSGTSGCKHSGALLFDSIGQNEKAFEEQNMYANANFEELIVDMSAGSGETLEGFGRTLGCGQDALGDFLDMTQKNFSEIYTSDKISPTELLMNTRKNIQKNTKLSSGCTAAA